MKSNLLPDSSRCEKVCVAVEEENANLAGKHAESVVAKDGDNKISALTHTQGMWLPENQANALSSPAPGPSCDEGDVAPPSRSIARKSSFPVWNLPSPSNFPAYTRAIASIPAMSAEEERRLVSQWQEKSSRQAAQELVVRHLYLVVKIVRNHRHYGMPMGDLAQEGTVGLMKAVKRFSPNKAARLATYAWYWIEAEIREFILKNWRIVAMGTSRLAKKVFFGYRRTLEKLHAWGEDRKPPSCEDIAKAMDISLSDAERARDFFMGDDAAWVESGGAADDDALDTHDAKSIATSRDIAVRPQVDNEGDDPIASIARTQAADQVRGLLPMLDDRSRSIVLSRHVMDPPKTLASLSKQWEISIERVRQIEKKALLDLKKQALAGVNGNTLSKNGSRLLKFEKSAP